MDLFAGVVDEAKAVVVSFLTDISQLGAVAFDNVQKCFNARIDAGVGRVGIQLQDQERFGAHDPLQIMQHEGIGRAGKIGNVGYKNIVFVFQKRAGFHVLLAVIPVHVGINGLVGKRKNIKRDDRVTTGGVFPGNAHIGVRGKGVIGTSQNGDDRTLCPVGLFKRLFAKFRESGKALHLFFMRQGEGIFCFGLTESQLSGHGNERFRGFFYPVRETDDRRQKFFIRNLRESLLDIIGKTLRDRAEIGLNGFFVTFHIPEVRQENVIDLAV